MITVADVTSETSDCQLGNGRNAMIPTTNATTVDTHGMPRLGDLRQALGGEPGLAERVGQARRGRDVDQAGARRRDERVDVEQDRQPGQAQRAGDRHVGPEVALADRVGPAAHEIRGVERADERDLEGQVDHDADRDGADQRPRHVALRVAGLAAHLGGLLEALQGEHHAERQRGEHPVGAVRGEPAARGEVRPVEGDEDQHDHREDRDRDLPQHRDPVGLREPGDPEQVDRR